MAEPRLRVGGIGSPEGVALEDETGAEVLRVAGGGVRGADGGPVEATGGVISNTADLADVLRREWVDVGQSMSLNVDKPVCVVRSSDNAYLAYRPVGGAVWEEVQFFRNNPSSPFTRNETWLREMMAYILATDSRVEYEGTWGDLNSGDPRTYVGGTARQTQVVGSSLTVEFTGGGDLYVIYVGRSSGVHVQAVLDGDTDNCDALPVGPDGIRYFDSFTDPDLAYKQRVKVASNIPEGPHTLVLTATSSKNPSASAGNRFAFNAVALVGTTSGLPYQAATRPSPWRAEVEVAAWHQINVEGRNYYATTSGTTGTTPPTHTSGTATDGSVVWQFMQSSSFSLRSHRIQAAGSETDLAYEIRPEGSGAWEDVGGNLHGNESVEGAGWFSDGVPVEAPNVGGWLVGRVLSFAQDTSVEVEGSEVAKISRNWTIRPEFLSLTHEHTWLANAEIGYFYSAMWPLLHYSTAGFQFGLDYMATPGGGTVKIEDYYGQHNPIEGRTRDYVMAAWGDVFSPVGSGGVPSNEEGPLTALALLSVSPGGTGLYREASSVYAGMATNIASRETAGGYESYPIKMYFERSARVSPTAVTAGERWVCSAEYHTILVPRSRIPFPPR